MVDSRDTCNDTQPHRRHRNHRVQQCAVRPARKHIGQAVERRDFECLARTDEIELRDAPGGGVSYVSKVKLTVKLSIPAVLLPPFIP